MSIGLTVGVLLSVLAGCGGGQPESVKKVVTPEGSELSLGDDVTVRIPAGALSSEGTLTISRPSEADPAPDPLEAGQPMGTAFSIDLGGQKLLKPATLELRYDAALLPEGMPEGDVFLTFFDEEQDIWVPVEGRIDQERDVVIAETDHLSWWNPWTWDWGAWIAVLNKTLEGNLTGWLEAAALLTNDCPQSGTAVSVDSSRANNVVQGCVEGDDPATPALRVVNPKSFYYEVKPTTGGNGYPPAGVLGPGDSLPFQANAFDPSPLVVAADMTQKSGAYLVVHLVIQMLPGMNQFGFQTKQVACITERLSDVSYIAAASEALLVGHNGTAAAEQIAKMLGDADVIRRFMTAADDCAYGAAKTWTIEGIKQIGAATATILSATDFATNYFLNYHSEVAFNWVRPATPTPGPTPIHTQAPTPIPPSDLPFDLQSYAGLIRNLRTAIENQDTTLLGQLFRSKYGDAEFWIANWGGCGGHGVRAAAVDQENLAAILGGSRVNLVAIGKSATCPGSGKASYGVISTGWRGKVLPHTYSGKGGPESGFVDWVFTEDAVLLVFWAESVVPSPPAFFGLNPYGSAGAFTQVGDLP